MADRRAQQRDAAAAIVAIVGPSALSEEDALGCLEAGHSADAIVGAVLDGSIALLLTGAASALSLVPPSLSFLRFYVNACVG